jgi:tRNA threonylcarbamoyladenosine biosynthesis protein TsaB
MSDSSTRILCIETSGGVGGVALACGDELIAHTLLTRTARHASDLFPTIYALCDAQGWSPTDLEACYVSIGPGSFTGLRVAVAAARHLSLAVGVRLIGVPSLDVIADGAIESLSEGEHLAVVLDAKKDHVFGAVFRRDGRVMARLTDVAMQTPAALLAASFGPCRVTGEGIPSHETALRAAGAVWLEPSSWSPTAVSVHRVGRRLAAAGRYTLANALLPHYVRRPEAEEIWERRNADTA